MKTATFGAGCFWHVEEEFRKIKGVMQTEVGYMGGDEKKYSNPTYEDVHTGKTGFVEVCKVDYNSKEVSYDELLKVFWRIHDPTQKNRQGWDIGAQYKSVIFYYDEEQKEIALKSKKKEQRNHDKEIVTEIVPAKKFYRAEEYHQKYLMKGGSCKI